MRIVQLALLLGLAVVGWLLGFSNATPLNLAFLGWQSPELPVFVFYLVFLFVGAVSGFLLGRLSVLSDRFRNRS